VCRVEFARQKQDAQQEFVSSQVEAIPSPGLESEAKLKQELAGTVKKKVTDRGFGFIRGEDGRDYFFHFTDLRPGVEFDEVQEGASVDFVIKRAPSMDKAGAAQDVRYRGG